MKIACFHFVDLVGEGQFLTDFTNILKYIDKYIKNTNKIITMSETPNLALKKFNTISFADKNYKSILSTTANRLSQRKSNSVLANPQSVMNTTLTNVEQNLSLPKIKQTRRKQKKQGTFLESWLDEALGAPDPFAVQKVQQQKVQSSVLKTLKKFQLDKRYLQSQNIPGEKIQKLYKSLYIYSHGVNKIFQDLMALTKQVQNPELINNFWRAYTKLMQGCSSYQTVFQKIEKDHLSNIQRLRSNIQIKAETFQQQKSQLNQKINKLQKVIQQKESKFVNLKVQFDVLQNTLDLTDQAFNEEVNLRLKFQEKINAIYTCYEELKSKYGKIVQEMGIRNTEILDRDNKEAILKGQLLVQKTRVQQLMFLLSSEKQKVKQRELQIAIKAQQLQDTKTIISSKKNQEQTINDKMQQHLSRLKSVQTRLIQVQNIVAGQKITINEQNQHITKITKALEQYKKHNNETYEKYIGAGKKIVELETSINIKDMKISQLERQRVEKGGEIADLSRELAHTKGQRDGLRHQLNIAVKNYNDTKQTMAKNNIILQQMKAVKDKYERINHYLRQQVTQLQNSNNKSMQDLSLKTQQLEGMKLLMDNRNKALTQLQKNFQQQKQLTKVKISALNVTITKKQNLCLQYQKKCDELQKQVQNSKAMVKVSQDKCIILESMKTKVEVQLGTKNKLLKDLDTVLHKENNKFVELNSKFENQLKQKASINSKLLTTQFVLKTKNQEERVQVASLGNLLNEYKLKLIEKSQYIHPMVHEQMLQIARRCERNQLIAKKHEEQNKKQLISCQKRAQALQIKLTQTSQLYAQLQVSHNTALSQNATMSTTLKQTQEKLTQCKRLLQKQQKSNKQFKADIEKRIGVEYIDKEKIKELESQIANAKRKIKDLDDTIVQLSRKKTSKGENRDTKKKPVLQKQIQTQQPYNEPSQKQDKQIQTQQIAQQKQQQQLQNIQQKQQQPLKPTIKQQSNQNNSSNISNINTSSINNSNNIQTKKQQIPQKKVQSKQFRKALKLTYMRR